MTWTEEQQLGWYLVAGLVPTPAEANQFITVPALEVADAMLRLHRRGIESTLVTVWHELERTGGWKLLKDGPVYLAKLLDDLPPGRPPGVTGER
jgi:replicative DNA helicase